MATVPEPAPASDPSTLTPEEAAELPGLVAEVLDAKVPRERLCELLESLKRSQQPALAAALCESVAYRIDIDEYWTYYRISRTYAALGPSRQDAAFFAASRAVQLHPDFSGSIAAFGELFRVLRRRGRDRDAVDLFRYQMEYLPERPAAEAGDILPLLQRFAVAPEPSRGAAAAAGNRLDHAVFAEETRLPWTCRCFGGRPECLDDLAAPMRRPAISVAELTDAEVLIYRDAVVVLDRAGGLHEDLSVSPFPAEILRALQRRQGEGRPVEAHAADMAVVIADRWPPPNLCHMLFDQVSRLAIYQRAGVDTAQALVIGPESRTDYQAEILRRAGVSRLLGTDRLARVRVGRLFVSSNCRDLQHAGHLGAAWVIEFIRQMLGGRGTKGWRRLYLSRADAGARQITNEAEVIRMLEPYGFDPIMPGRLRYDAQLAAFRQASHVVSGHGAALAHTVLCPPGAQVLEIFHPLYGTPAYAQQAAAAGLDYVAMLGRDGVSDRPEWNDPATPHRHAGGYGERHIRVDLDLLGQYLATLR